MTKEKFDIINKKIEDIEWLEDLPNLVETYPRIRKAVEADVKAYFKQLEYDIVHAPIPIELRLKDIKQKEK